MYETILFPTDGSEGARAAAETAIDLARQYGATLHVLYVADTRMSPISSRMDTEEALDLIEHVGERPTAPIAERAAEAGVDATEVIRLGVPHRAIREYVDEADVDMVVMGTHGRTGLRHALLGSVTERVVRTSSVPVVAVPMNGDGETAEGSETDDTQ